MLPKKSPFNFLLRNEENQPLKEAVINVIILLPCGTNVKLRFCTSKGTTKRIQLLLITTQVK